MHSSLDWFGTFRGRLGYTFDRTLLFATGGFAFGGLRDQLTGSVVFLDVDGSSKPMSAKAEDVRTGFVLGGGFEYALTPAWSLKAEYQYLDLGSTTLSAATGRTDFVENGSGSAKLDNTFHTVRLGLNYHVGQGYEPLK